MYTENEIVSIARRENNNKRKYLVVNRLQGKHIPVIPSEALDMFQELGKLIQKEYQGERLLIIGFAETATAIGASLAIQTDSPYIQTTREREEGVTYLYFTESHSHAEEQKLVRDDIASVIKNINRIIFAEDEITTGNTILKIVNILKREFPEQIKFSAASILNGMNHEAEKIYAEQQIRLHYLIKTNHESYTDIAEQYRGDGIRREFILQSEEQKTDGGFMEFLAEGYENARRLVTGSSYRAACEQLWQQVKSEYGYHSGDKTDILVLGTEEFMYPALYVAAQLENMGNNVRYHATTRSPIEVSREENYPLHERFELRSLYDKDRVTYIYELKKYSEVLVITDAVSEQSEGISSLVNALKEKGNMKIHIVRWCKA